MTLSPHRRWPRARAILGEIAGLIGWTTLVLAGGSGVLFARTQAGREAVSALDAAVIAALVLAVPPAWFARRLVPADNATKRDPGAATSQGFVRGALRALVHPLAVVMWAWAALVAVAAGLPIVALVLGGIAALVGLAGVISAALWLVAPSRPALHDLVARLWPAAGGSNE